MAKIKIKRIYVKELLYNICSLGLEGRQRTVKILIITADVVESPRSGEDENKTVVLYATPPSPFLLNTHTKGYVPGRK